MLPLLVRITNTQSGETEHSAFASSPVRIGRNQLNELVLNEPFVSQWHAVIRFDENRVKYVDLGSTNGTTLGGRRLAKHMAVDIEHGADLRIGPIQLSFARAQVTPDMYAAPRTTIFHMEQPTGAGGGGLPSATVVFNPNDPATLPQSTMFLQPGQLPQFQRQADAGATTPMKAPQPPPVQMQQLLGYVQQVKPSYDAYRQSFAQLLVQLRNMLERMPTEQRAPLVMTLSQQYPMLPKEPDFRSLVTGLGVPEASLGEVDVTEWIKRLGGGENLPPGTVVNSSIAMERVGALLESYSQAFVELRKGYEQFGEEMALQLVQERNPLHDADAGQDVLSYLLDWNVDGGERVRELTRAFADLALHQVALLNGVMEGVRAMLGRISPQELSGNRDASLAREGGGGFLEGIFNLKKAALWRRYAEQHMNLVDEDRFSREVFGRSFARAYFMVTGGLMQGEEPGTGMHPSVSSQRPPYGHPHTRPYG
jgi:type VI secretion system FHA domain protein